ncbi:hypothetical protein GCM10023336_40180 [Streptomyces similanensis]|uniref:Uncharacterized protein n=1 Tax=Streptomyces similanensis TaxID=1274988 RepID=A0ABP9KR99_9ACTN
MPVILRYLREWGGGTGLRCRVVEQLDDTVVRTGARPGLGRGNTRRPGPVGGEGEEAMRG